LLAAAAAGVIGLGFLGFSPNRILSAKSISLTAVDAPWPLAVMAAGAGVIVLGMIGWPRRSEQLALLFGAAIVLLASFAAAGTGATTMLVDAASPAARVSLGGAFWLLVVTGSLAIAEALKRLRIGPARRVLFGAAIAGFIVAMATAGWFNDLSIVREWANRKEEYSAALLQHVILVLSALTVSLLVGLPIGLLASTRPRRAAGIFALLNIIQTVPSIALFGLLIGPLTAVSEAVPGLRSLGVRGIGFTPALIALVLYGLLPIARNTQAGLAGVPASALEAARGMGMAPFQIVTRVSIPLALPVLLAGVRIVTVQTIGMAVVAALIGAGGLGSFVFLGLGQTATDLVLLGALSVIALALIADAALRLLALAATRDVAA
jgi:osmoprotectant transport system permease protein